MNRGIPGWAMMMTTLFGVGCAPPAAVGDWEGADSVAGERNALELEDGGRGQAEIYFFYGGDAYRAEFDVEWEEQDGEIVVDLECDGDCSDLDFEMECEMSRDEEEMECDGDGSFSDYDFEWERD